MRSQSAVWIDLQCSCPHHTARRDASTLRSHSLQLRFAVGSRQRKCSRRPSHSDTSTGARLCSRLPAAVAAAAAACAKAVLHHKVSSYMCRQQSR